MSRPLPRILTALVAALTLVLTACGAGGNPAGDGTGNDEKTLRFVTVYPPNTTDAHMINAAFVLNSGTVEMLMGIDPETLDAYPWLAESYETEDAQHWSFTIRE